MKKFITHIFFVLVLFGIVEGQIYRLDTNKRFIKIDGEVNFYWKKLILPEDIKYYQPQKIIIPSDFKYYFDTHYGYGTYYFKIIVPEKGPYAFKFKRIYSAYKVYVNNKLITKNGKVGINYKTETPDWRTKIVPYYAEDDTLNVVIHVSNFHYRKAGIRRAIFFGSDEEIYKQTLLSAGTDFILLGALLIFGLFFFVQYINNRLTFNLYFGLFLISQAVITSLDNELVFFKIFPHINWAIAIKIYYILLFWRVAFFMMFLKEYASETKTKIFNFLTFFWLISGNLFILFTPVTIYSNIIIYYAATAFILMLILIYIFLKNIKLRDLKKWVAVLAALTYFIAGVSDVYNEFFKVNANYVLGFTSYGIALIFSVLLSMKNANISYEIESLRDKVAILANLKDKLLSLPTYKVYEIFKAYLDVLKVERGLFFVENEGKLVLEVEVLVSSEILRHHKIIEKLEKDCCDLELVKIAIDLKHNFFYDGDDKSVTTFYTDNFNVKSIAVIPLFKKDKIIAVLYLENLTYRFTDAQKDVINSTTYQFIKIIETAFVYWSLQNLNETLDKKVEEKTKIVESQKLELIEKNKLLDEKVAKLTEYNQILNKINEELEVQTQKLEEKNRILEQQNEELTQQKEELQYKNKLITANIQYAKRLQDLMIYRCPNPPFEKYFELFLPKDIVSGDFYFSKWFDDKFVFALADCTGHGVPGALLTMLSSSALNDIISHKKQAKPSEVLNDLREFIINNLSSSEVSDTQIRDGLDIALCFYYPQKNLIEFAGAYNSVVVISNDGNITEYKGDRMPIGSYFDNYIKDFSTKIIQLNKNDMLYLFTDGFSDQFGGENHTKYYKKNFKKLLLNIFKLEPEQQKDLIYKEFIKWKNGYEQTDDISIIGIKF